MHDLLQNNLIHRIYAFEAASRISPRGRAKTYPIAVVLDRIFFVCKMGCQWNQLLTEQCSYKTIFHYFSKWSKARLFEDAFYELAGRIQCERAIVDTSFVKHAKAGKTWLAETLLIGDGRQQKSQCLRMSLALR